MSVREKISKLQSHSYHRFSESRGKGHPDTTITPSSFGSHGQLTIPPHVLAVKETCIDLDCRATGTAEGGREAAQKTQASWKGCILDLPLPVLSCCLVARWLILGKTGCKICRAQHKIEKMGPFMAQHWEAIQDSSNRAWSQGRDPAACGALSWLPRPHAQGASPAAGDPHTHKAGERSSQEMEQSR